MNASTLAWLMSGVLLNAAAQLMLKAGASSVGSISLSAGASGLMRIGMQLAVHPGILGGLACYVVSVVAWIVALSRVDVSVAYPMLSVGYVINALLAWWLFGEAVSLQRWLGIAVIIFGVVLVARSANPS